VGATLRTRRRENETPTHLKDAAYGGGDAYLRVEKPRFLFLGGSAGVVAAADVATAAPPVISAARAGTSAARVASLVGCLAAGAPAPSPGAVSSAASAALGEGAKAPPLGEGLSPIALLLLVRRRVLRSRRGGESLLLMQLELLVVPFPVLPSSDPFLLLARRPLLFPPLRRARARARGVGRSDRAAFTVTSCRGGAKGQTSPARRK
jgi:hypothetical protein